MKTLETSTSISFKNILFLMDFTDASDAARAYAMTFARHYNARLFPTYVQMPGAGTYVTAYAFDYAQKILEGNRDIVTQVFKDSGLDCQPLVEEGLVEEVAPRLIQEHGIDLVVMGTHGRSGVRKLVLGSTAETIFRTVNCPVLTVGPHVAEHQNWEPDRGPAIKSIVLATDLSPDSEYAVSYALSFAHESHCKITLLHVVSEALQHHADHARLLAFMQSELKRLVPSESQTWCEPRFRVEEGDPGEQILKVAREEDAGLLVLGLPKNKQFSARFRSGVAYSVISHARCPVLTVRDARV